mmetsp:Transcript_129628/g.288982  ORF Transcript_129628/g.288982 Transcript_129628/m.288982 type:complete len:240 (-) Transcript_129628:8-727(-)
MTEAACGDTGFKRSACDATCVSSTFQGKLRKSEAWLCKRSGRSSPQPLTGWFRTRLFASSALAARHIPRNCLIHLHPSDTLLWPHRAVERRSASRHNSKEAPLKLEAFSSHRCVFCSLFLLLSLTLRRSPRLLFYLKLALLGLNDRALLLLVLLALLLFLLFVLLSLLALRLGITLLVGILLRVIIVGAHRASAALRRWGPASPPTLGRTAHPALRPPHRRRENGMQGKGRGEGPLREA